MRRKKILHLIETTGAGGAETILYRVVMNLSKKEYSSIIVLPTKGLWLWNVLEDAGCELRYLPSEKGYDWKLLQQLCRLVKEEKIDFIHAHLFSIGVYASLVGILSRLPVILTLHGQVKGLDTQSFKQRIKVFLLNRGINQYVTVSNYLKKILTHEYSIKDHHIQVVPNGIELDKYVPREKDIQTPPVIGALGNLRRPKSYETLIQAINLLKERGISLKCQIVGDDENAAEYKQELTDLIHSLGLSEVVLLREFQADVSAVMQEFDVYVMCSESEGFSLSTIEAMAKELPVVATKCGGPEEIITDRQDGILVDKKNPTALADAIEQILQSPNLAKSLGQNARKTVVERYSLQKMMEGYEAVYREVLE